MSGVGPPLFLTAEGVGVVVSVDVGVGVGMGVGVGTGVPVGVGRRVGVGVGVGVTVTGGFTVGLGISVTIFWQWLNTHLEVAVFVPSYLGIHKTKGQAVSRHTTSIWESYQEELTATQAESS